MAEKIEKSLFEIHSKFEKLISDDDILNDIVINQFNSRHLSWLQNKPFSLFIYSGKELIFWNDNSIIPPDFLITAMSEGSHSIRLQNGYYEIFKLRKTIDNKEFSLIKLVLLKKNYPVENKYLSNTFNPIFDLPPFAEMNFTEDETGTPVINAAGKTLFHLHIDASKKSSQPDVLKAIFSLLAFAFLLLSLYYSVKQVAQHSGVLAFFSLSSAFIIVRWITLISNFPPGLYDFELFNPQLYASSVVNKSLGDLFINMLLIFWLTFFYVSNIKIEFFQKPTRAAQYIISPVLIFLIFWISRAVAWLFRSLLIDSKIPFDVTDFLNLNIYSFIGLACISLSLICFALLAIKFLKLINYWQLPKKVAFASISSGFLLYLFVIIVLEYPRLEFMAAFAVLLFVAVLHRILRKELSLTTISNIAIIIGILSIFSSIYLHNYIDIRDLDNRKALARKLSLERDLVTEYLFLDVQEKIVDDLFIRNYFRKPFISTAEIVDRIRNKYFSGFFRKYDVNIYTLNTEGRLLRSANEEYLDLLSDELLSRAQQTLSDYLFFIPKPSGNFAYISNLPVLYRGKLIGNLVLEFTPRTYSQPNLYPELLLEEKVKPPETLERYSFGLYSFGNLVRKSGNYPYPFHFVFDTTHVAKGEEFYELKENDLKHLIYRINDEKSVIVTADAEKKLQPVSLFSYLFCIYLLCALTFISLRYLSGAFQMRQQSASPFTISFRDKIQFSMIFIIIFSFFVIGYVTIYHFVSEYERSHTEMLVRKANDIRTAIEYVLKEDTTIIFAQQSNLISTPIDLVALSDIHDIDINIYGDKGKISNTSQPEIFERGLISDIMHPVAFKEMAVRQRSQYLQNEKIGSLEYLSVYLPVKNNEGALLAYLNVPYFAKERELNNEISSLLVTLVNVYVLLLVLAGFLAYLLSDSVTRSLSAISQKLKLVKLGKKNEPIEWKSNDEIGTLVAEYNKMIAELERSAELLARSEREIAWREMAKQIAHEIKNPLTPMKLSIQHLQRAMSEGDPRAKDLAKKVAATLTEQIDNLAHIATEFSSFAKMPRAQNEELVIADIIRSVVDLFNEEQNISIHLNEFEKDVTVFADKNQLLSAFNNLVKNATQAIPFNKKGIIEINLRTEEDHVVISIKDNGIGISPEQQQKVFVPNFTTKSGGTGLGLALTKQIIENAHGKIWFESSADQGTTFFVELPKF